MADFQHILSNQRPGTENNIINLLFGNPPLIFEGCRHRIINLCNFLSYEAKGSGDGIIKSWERIYDPSFEDTRRHRRNPPPSSSCLYVVLVSSTKYEDTAKTPLRVLVFMLSCHCVMEDTRKDRPPIFQTDLFFCCLMSSTTKGPTADFPDRPFTLVSCGIAVKYQTVSSEKTVLI